MIGQRRCPHRAHAQLHRVSLHCRERPGQLREHRRRLHAQGHRVTRLGPGVVRHHHVVVAAVGRLHVGQAQAAPARPLHHLASLVPLVADRLRPRRHHAQCKRLAQHRTPAFGLRHDACRLHHRHRDQLRLHSACPVAHRHLVVVRVRRGHVGQAQCRAGGSVQCHAALAPLIGDRSRANGGDRQLNAVSLNQRHRLGQLGDGWRRLNGEGDRIAIQAARGVGDRHLVVTSGRCLDGGQCQHGFGGVRDGHTVL